MSWSLEVPSQTYISVIILALPSNSRTRTLLITTALIQPACDAGKDKASSFHFFSDTILYKSSIKYNLLRGETWYDVGIYVFGSFRKSILWEQMDRAPLTSAGLCQVMPAENMTPIISLSRTASTFKAQRKSTHTWPFWCIKQLAQQTRRTGKGNTSLFLPLPNITVFLPDEFLTAVLFQNLVQRH